MLCCNCGFSCCIFNDSLLFCINLEFLKLKAQAPPPHTITTLHATACVKQWKSYKPFIFLINTPLSHMGTQSFLLCRATCLLAGVQPFRGCIRSLSAKHYAIANGLYRRQEAGAAGPLKAQQQPPPPFFEFIYVHAWTPVLSPCRHTRSSKWTHMVFCLPRVVFPLSPSTSLPSCHVSLPAWSRCCLSLPQCLGLAWEQWHYISLTGSWKKWRERIYIYSFHIRCTPFFPLSLRCECLHWIC